jgi:thioredoxin-related protein
MGADPVVARAAASDRDGYEILDLDDTPRVRNLQYPDWFKISFLDLPVDLEEAVTAGKFGLVVYFGQKHCAYCEALLEVNLGREADIAEYMQRHFDVVPLDIWGSREVRTLDGAVLDERGYAVREGTNFTPSLLFFDRDGELVLRLRGYHPPYRFRAALRYVVDGYARTESLREYMARADPPPKFEVGDLNERDFFAPPPHALDRTRFAASKPLVVFFEQRDCHACDILHGDPLQDPETLSLLTRFEAVQLGMRSDSPVLTPDGRRLTAREWADKLGLFYAPTLVFFDQRGTERIRIAAVARLYRVKGVLQYMLARGYERYPTFQHWREYEAGARLERPVPQP